MPIHHDDLPAWLGVPFDTLKKALAGLGVNSRGWRLYLDHGDALFAPLQRPWLSQHSNSNKAVLGSIWLRLLQRTEMDVPPPLALSESIANWNLPGQGFGHIPPLFLRAAWKATMAAEYSGRNVEHFVTNEVVPLARWFFTSGQHMNTDPNLLKAGWEALERRWREQVARSPDPRELGNGEWPFPLRNVEYGGLRFIPLVNTSALKDEGLAMSHCIGDYGDRCRNTSLRAFSVRHRKTGARLATLTVAHESGFWQLMAISGPKNAEVDDRIVLATNGLLLSLDEATAENVAFRAFLDKLKARLSFDEVDEFDDDCCLPF